MLSSSSAASQRNTMDTVIKGFFFEMIHQERNAKRENPLHYVCNRNKYQLIPALLEKGCHLCQQDYLGRTPIHVAIDADHRECIKVFQYLLHSYQALNVQLQKDLRTLMKCYNNKGYTILHEATLKDMTELVSDLLIFCKDRDINLVDSEVLGCGDTILHLAVRKNLLKIAEIVCKMYPNLVKCRNYGGSLPGDLNCVTDEMKLILRNRNL